MMITGLLPPGKDWVDLMDAFAETIGGLATAAALWVTWRTLREMKRQTDLANNPHLKLRFRHWPKLSEDSLTAARSHTVLKDYYDITPYETWRQIITKNLDQDLTDLKDDFLVLELSNAGKSEITNVSLQLNLHVSMFDNDVLAYKITPTLYSWSKDIVLELSEPKLAYLPIANTKYFPIYGCRILDICYKDVRGIQYYAFDGPTEIAEQKDILRPRHPPPYEEPEEPPPGYLEESNIPF